MRFADQDFAQMECNPLCRVPYRQHDQTRTALQDLDLAQFGDKCLRERLEPVYIRTRKHAKVSV